MRTYEKEIEILEKGIKELRADLNIIDEIVIRARMNNNFSDKNEARKLTLHLAAFMGMSDALGSAVGRSLTAFLIENGHTMMDFMLDTEMMIQQRIQDE